MAKNSPEATADSSPALRDRNEGTEVGIIRPQMIGSDTSYAFLPIAISYVSRTVRIFSMPAEIKNAVP